MKRIITFDFLRGLSIFIMQLVHTWLNIYDLNIIYNTELSKLNPVILIMGVFLFVIGHSRSFFLFISAIVHQYNISCWLIDDKSPEQMLQKNLISGFLLYLLGIIREGFLNPWSVLYNKIVDGMWTWNSMYFAYMIETLQIIGCMMIFLGILNYIFAKIHWTTKKWFQSLILFVLAMGFIFFAPLVQHQVSLIVGFNVTFWTYGSPISHWWEYITRFFWFAIAGQEEPVFPNFGCVCIGAIIAILLTQPHPSKRLLFWGHMLANLFLIGGILHWIYIDNMVVDMSFRVHPTWFFLANLGFHLHIVLLFLGAAEFNPKGNIERYKRRTQFFRRWGLVALTIYMYQLFEVYTRIFATKLFGVELIVRNRLGLGWSIVMMIIAGVFIDLVIRMWEKINFIGSWEWILLSLTKGLTRSKHGSKDRIAPTAALYDVTPITFYPQLELNNN